MNDGNNGEEDVVLMALTKRILWRLPKKKSASHKQEHCFEHNEFCLMITNDEQKDKKPSEKEGQKRKKPTRN